MGFEGGGGGKVNSVCSILCTSNTGFWGVGVFPPENFES